MSVGAGLGMVGIGSAATMAFAARALNEDGFAAFATWWTIANLFGLTFAVVETYLPRLIVAARSHDEDDGPLLARFARALFLVVAGLGLLLVVTAPWTLPRFFSQSIGLLLLTIVYVLAMTLQSLQRAAAIGRSTFDVFAAQLGADGLIRFAGSVIAAIVGVDSPEIFAGVVCAAAMLGLLAGTPLDRRWFRWAHPASGLSWVPLGFLLVASLGPLVINNVGVPWLSATRNVNAATIGAVAGALTLSRVPTLLVGSAYGPVLTPLARAVEAQLRDHFRHIHRTAAAVALVLALGFVVLFAVAGPRLLELYLGPSYQLPVLVLAVMAAGSGLMFVGVVEQAALVAMTAWPSVAAAWTTGVVAFGLSLISPMTPVHRVALAVCLGPLAAVLVMAVRRRTVEASTFA
jgi:O-antigen/teichoic acid export membrane protein